MQKRVVRSKRNPESREVLEKVLEHLGTHCPRCGADRTISDLNILGKSNNVYMVHIGCKACGSHDVFHFVANVGYSTAGGIVTDISPAEAPLFLQSAGVSKDDMLDVYLLLRDTTLCSEFVKKLPTKRVPADRRVVKAPAPTGAPMSSAVA